VDSVCGSKRAYCYTTCAWKLACANCIALHCIALKSSYSTQSHQKNAIAEELLKGGSEKPSPCIFAKACNIAQCEPQDAIHVGDSLQADVQGAINGGLQGSVWVNATGLQPPAGAPKCTCQIQHIRQLQPLLERCL
jgi:phosphoglycolate phosphatase-like HAD superfamily hydrolase